MSWRRTLTGNGSVILGAIVRRATPRPGRPIWLIRRSVTWIGSCWLPRSTVSVTVWPSEAVSVAACRSEASWTGRPFTAWITSPTWSLPSAGEPLMTAATSTPPPLTLTGYPAARSPTAAATWRLSSKTCC